MPGPKQKENDSTKPAFNTYASTPAKKKTILVVDDDPMISKLTRAILKKAGFETISARNALEGIKKLIKHPEISLALLDVNMPDIDGIQLLKMIRILPAFDKLPIVMVIGKGEIEEVVQSIKANAQDYIFKPASKDAFLGKICGQLQIGLEDLTSWART